MRSKGSVKTVFWIAVVTFLLVIAVMAMQSPAGALMGSVPFMLCAVLAADRNTPQRPGDSLNLGVAAAKKIFAGSLVARDANGYATPGATATTLVGLGRAREQVDNSSGADGDVTVDIEKGVFRFANSAGGDEITAVDIGSDCYIVDDQTVAKTDGTGTRSVAGKVFDVDANGVWVKFD